jgi:hypothetical protein
VAQQPVALLELAGFGPPLMTRRGARPSSGSLSRPHFKDTGEATLGVHFTRNIFAKLGYRYVYVDYDNNGLLYQMNSFGLFSGIGVKF